ncbi:hydroperoxide isomerase ALOXE3-like isoform X2 [Pagrus major]|uniref:hydroperoxide isomerase ALOXE3-like isoform X2 n=1 Tax=Pagrus major TaxID=143350 RepID=UPI003CC883DF
MAAYTLEVTTGSMLHAGTFNNLFVTLIGTERQSEPTQLTGLGLDEKPGKVGTYSVTTLFSLGCLLLLKLEKDPFHESPERDWFCSKIVVKTPEEYEILFPCHRWLSRGESVFLRGGRATKAFEDLHPRLLEQRKKELLQQKITYKWSEYADGMPYMLNIPNPRAVPTEISYSQSKAFQFESRRQNIGFVLKLKDLTDEPWESFEAMKEFPWFKDSPLLEYVSQHWQDDDFFGYQFLNGANPHSIQRCSTLPSNFPVAEEMVKPFLANGSSLTAEMKKGNIFITNYKIMDGLPTRVIDGKLAVLTAPLCLLYLNPEKKLQPIAIQTSLDVDGLIELFRRGFSQTNYSSLCLPENIADRGVESIPNFHYRDDALRLWRIINSFVKAVVAYYYPSDSEVAADSELQEWINEIFYYGFLGNGDSGIPSSFQTVEELIKFVTMVIFTSSVQHAVIGNAQFDFLAWIPNGPMMLNQAPPTTKGQSSVETIFATLAYKRFTAQSVSVLWLISRKYDDFTPLGTYPEQRFDEPAVLQMIKDFQAELSSLSADISKRNSELELPYYYLNPENIENSVAN